MFSYDNFGGELSKDDYFCFSLGGLLSSDLDSTNPSILKYCVSLFPSGWYGPTIQENIALRVLTALVCFK